MPENVPERKENMIKSMTGYGKARLVTDGRDVTVEIKSVNHRYFEMFARIPRAYMQIEDMIRSYLQTRIVRGKIEVNVSIADNGASVSSVKVNKPLFEAYYAALKDVSETYSLPFDAGAAVALRFPDVIAAEKEDEDVKAVWASVLPALEAATDAFIAQREAEGGRLSKDIQAKCAEIKSNVDFIESRSAQLIGEYEKKLRARIEELLGDVKVDEQRLLTEVAVMADRIFFGQNSDRRRTRAPEQPLQNACGYVCGRCFERQEDGLLHTGDEPRGEHYIVQDRRP